MLAFRYLLDKDFACLELWLAPYQSTVFFFFNMVICWMLLDVVIGFICLLSGDINLIGTACYDTTRRADRRCCFFPVGGARGEVTAAVGAETRPK